jgi:hypothetical protein
MEDPISLNEYSPISLSTPSPIEEETENETEQTAENENGEILVVSVEIADGHRDVIKVYNGDDPVKLAREFAEKHGLDPML